MKRVINLLAVTALAVTTAISLFGAGPAQAASFTYNDASCSSFSVQDQGGGSISIQCSRLDCTITPNVPSAQINWNVVVTATCTPPSGATTYTWSKLNSGDSTCPGPPAPGAATTLAAPNAVASGCSYRLTASDPTYGIATRTVNMNWGAVSGPAGCSISANPTNLGAGGGPVSLSMNCTSGGAPTSYTWSGGFAQGASGQQVSGTITTTTSFSVIASNGSGSATASTTVTVDVSNPPGGGGDVSCASQGFSNTRVLDISWAAPSRVLSISQGGMGPNDATVVRFTTGPNTSANAGHITATEYQAQPSNKIVSLAATSCDFSGSMAIYAGGGGTTASVNFYVGGTGGGLYPVLQPNTQYFFNIRNGLNPDGTCLNGNCNLAVDLIKPNGL